jgi:hypothetical protein
MQRQLAWEGAGQSREGEGYSESRAARTFGKRVFNVPQQICSRNGQIMHESAHGMRRSYKAGCRCDLCKQAENEYRRGLRQRRREEVGEFVTRAVPSLSLVAGGGGAALTSGNAANISGAVESAVSLEIEGLGAISRPGIAAAALALARVLDNPKAVSTQPAAAAKLAHLLDMLRKGSRTKAKLASVRQMTRSERT